MATTLSLNTFRRAKQAAANMSAGDRLRAFPCDAKSIAAEADRWTGCVARLFAREFEIGQRSAAMRWAKRETNRLAIKRAFYQGSLKAVVVERLIASYIEQDAA